MLRKLLAITMVSLLSLGAVASELRADKPGNGTMSYQERRDAIMNGELAVHQAFEGFDFTRPLDADTVPDTDIVALTGRLFAQRDSPANPWQRKQRRIVLNRFAQTKGRILIAPSQSIGYGFTYGHRAALGLALANQIERDTGWPTLDPILTKQALGRGLRTNELDALLEFARQAGAYALLVPSFGHDNGSQLFARFKLFLVSDADKDEIPYWEMVRRNRFDETTGVLPAISPILRDLTQALSQQLGASKHASQTAVRYNTIDIRVPRSIASDRTTQPGLNQAYDFQWLAMMLSPETWQLRQELFARSLVIASHPALINAPSARLLRARALAELGALPAARGLLVNQKDAASEAYLAFSLGQIAKTRDSLTGVTNRAQREILQRDLQRLMLAAGRPQWQDLAKAIMTAQPQWAPFLRHRLPPAQTGSLELSSSLIPLLPASTSATPAHIRRGPLNPHTDVAVLNNIDSALFKPAVCDEPGRYCAAAAYLDVLDALATDASIAVLNSLLYSPVERAFVLHYLGVMDEALKGNSSFEKMVIRTLSAITMEVTADPDVFFVGDRGEIARDFLATAIEYTADYMLQPPAIHHTSKLGDREIDLGLQLIQRAHERSFPPRYSALSAHKAQTSRALDYVFYALPRNFSDAFLSDRHVLPKTMARFSEHQSLRRRIIAITAQ